MKGDERGSKERRKEDGKEERIGGNKEGRERGREDELYFASDDPAVPMTVNFWHTNGRFSESSSSPSSASASAVFFNSGLRLLTASARAILSCFSLFIFGSMKTGKKSSGRPYLSTDSINPLMTFKCTQPEYTSP